MSAANEDVEKNLLTSLMAVIRPLVLSHSGLGTQDDRLFPSSLSDVENGTEGIALIRAMTNFVEAVITSSIINSKTSKTIRGTEDSSTVPLKVSDGKDLENQVLNPNHSTSTDQNASHQSVNDKGSDVHVSQVSAGVPLTELESMILTKTRAHIFNNMPIRLLAFDSTGSNPRLIHREEVFGRILQGVQKWTGTEDFQRQWASALGLQHVDISWTPRYDRMSELVNQAIGHNVHYSILSHTWMRGSPGDVVFSDWEKRFENPLGYAKVIAFCEVSARDHGITLGWLDTVCINKDSSSELDESIRSMYKWYRGSRICITYLSETDAVDDGRHDSWFTRAWTLQELLAPERSFFYNKNWVKLGFIDDDNIQGLINVETSITKRELALCKQGEIDKIPLSRRLQMASRRQATREEDSLYSLLGLLGVSISVAYGEGSARAFERLFKELLSTKKHIFDLFNRAYLYQDTLIPRSITSYAKRNRGFDYFTAGTELDTYLPAEPIIVTHLGVRIQVLLIPTLGTWKEKDMDYKPKGDFSGVRFLWMAENDGRRKLYLYMLDSRLYLEDSKFQALWITDAEIPRRTLIAVLNIVVSDGLLLLPKGDCYGIEMYTPDKPGTIGPASKISLLARGFPTKFKLKSTNDIRSVPITNLGLHGMQLVTLYL